MSVMRLDIHVLAANGNIMSDERPNEFLRIALSRSAPPNGHFSRGRLGQIFYGIHRADSFVVTSSGNILLEARRTVSKR